MGAKRASSGHCASVFSAHFPAFAVCAFTHTQAWQHRVESRGQPAQPLDILKRVSLSRLPLLHSLLLAISQAAQKPSSLVNRTHLPFLCSREFAQSPRRRCSQRPTAPAAAAPHRPAAAARTLTRRAIQRHPLIKTGLSQGYQDESSRSGEKISHSPFVSTLGGSLIVPILSHCSLLPSPCPSPHPPIHRPVSSTSSSYRNFPFIHPGFAFRPAFVSYTPRSDLGNTSRPRCLSSKYARYGWMG